METVLNERQLSPRLPEFQNLMDLGQIQNNSHNPHSDDDLYKSGSVKTSQFKELA